jgi:dihydropyrimidinase
MKKLIIRDGQIISDGIVHRSDILIQNGKIEAVEKNIVSSADEVIDASDCRIFPGGIDPHVHLRLRTPYGVSSDDFLSGTRAALAGGTTTIIDFVTPRRGESLLDALNKRKKQAKKAVCDYGFHMGISSWDRNHFKELEVCSRKEGITSVKAYMAYKESIGISDEEFFNLLDAAKKLKLLTLIHAEAGDMVTYLQKKLLSEGNTSANYHPLSRPPEVENDAIRRALLMAQLAEVPLYFVHVSTRQGIRAISNAQREGKKIYAETCPQYLILTKSRYIGKSGQAALFVMSPPLRGMDDCDALWEGLSKKNIQCVGTDHCPFNLSEKMKFAMKNFTKIPNGCGGIENRLSLLYSFGVRTGKISIERFVDLIATEPAMIFGLYPRKGTIRPGSDADVVIWDPNIEETISAKEQWQHCDYSVFQGFKLKGRPRFVLSRGEIVFAENRVYAKEGRGLFLIRGEAFL